MKRTMRVGTRFQYESILLRITEPVKRELRAARTERRRDAQLIH